MMLTERDEEDLQRFFEDGGFTFDEVVSLFDHDIQAVVKSLVRQNRRELQRLRRWVGSSIGMALSLRVVIIALRNIQYAEQQENG